MTTHPSTIQNIRTRFAPSPTGLLHIGGLRTALYAFLFARKYNGQFILRIEDTDKQRQIDGALENIITVLRDAGLDYQEGPIKTNSKIYEIGGYGPYTQSKRIDLYTKTAEDLVKKNAAYYCFCTSKRLEEMRKKQIAQKQIPRYDKKCRDLSPQDIKEKMQAKIPHVIRMSVPKDGTTSWHDKVRGKVSFEHVNIDDQVLLKSDGFPTYHLAVVVDDHMMQITHVFRGEEWLSSTPKHLLLYKALNWNPPVFVHLPLIVDTDRKKLSKRKGDLSVSSFYSKGYLMRSLINFVALLGWNPKSTEEIFTKEELVTAFSIEKINKAAAVFDIKRLNWLNSQYIKSMNDHEFTERCTHFLKQKKIDISSIDFDDLSKVLHLDKMRIEKLEDVGTETDFFFESTLTFSKNLLRWKGMTFEDIKHMLEISLGEFSSIQNSKFKSNEIENIFFSRIKKDNLKTGEILWPLRVSLTGKKNSPGPFESAEILGKKRSLERVQDAINKLSQ